MPTYVDDYTALISGTSWAGPSTAPTVVTYSFDTEVQDYLAASFEQGFIDSFLTFTATQRSLTQSALAAWEATSGIVFVEVASGQGDIRFGNFDFDESADINFGSGFAYYPGQNVTDTYIYESPIGGDVFINYSRISNMSWGLIAHEIGHAIGMEHPHDGEVQLQAAYDTGAYTVMSYNRGNQTQLGVFDHQAAQNLYGAATFEASATGGIQSFAFNEPAMQVVQGWGDAASQISGTSLSDVISAGAGDDDIGGFGGDDSLSGDDGNDMIEGGDGDDTISGGLGNDSLYGGNGFDDLSGQDVVDYAAALGAVTVDLDSYEADSYQIGTATGTDIGTDALYGFLAVIGGQGGDRLEGSRHDNLLIGNNGDDTLDGQDGNDLLQGGIGNDSLLGGLHDDTLIGDGGFDTLEGGDGDDLLNGGFGADSLLGGAGADRLLGESGFDNLYGGDGNDTILAGDSADRAYGGDGDDVIRGGINVGGSVDGLQGDAGNDTIYGDGGFDLLNGGTGDDLLDGGNQADNLYGEAGNDTLLGGNGFDRLFGGADDDLMDGGASGDALLGEAGNDTMIGGEGDDRLLGGLGNDLMQGGIGNDSIYGNAGFDTLDGGAGDDLLRGDFNADTFVFADGHGNDTLIGFDAISAGEVMDFSALSSMNDIGQVLAAATQVGGNVVIDTGDGNSITLNGVDRADLDASDFLFA